MSARTPLAMPVIKWETLKKLLMTVDMREGIAQMMADGNKGFCKTLLEVGDKEFAIGAIFTYVVLRVHLIEDGLAAVEGAEREHPQA